MTMPLCLKLRKSFKTSMHILLSQKCSTLMCVTTCPFRMCPCLIRRPKQSYGNDESRAASNAISVSAYIRSAVYVGYLRLMVQHPVQAQPVRAFLYRSTVLLTHGIPMAGLHALAYTASSGKFVVAFITSYYICNLVFLKSCKREKLESFACTCR